MRAICIVLAALTQFLSAQEMQPIALVVDVDAEKILVANRASGTLSTVDLNSRACLSNHVIGKQLSSMAAVPGTSRVLVTDEEAHQLILLEDGNVQTRLSVSKFPVEAAVSQDGRLAVVASLWSRVVTFVAIEGTSLELGQIVPLSFSPRSLAFIEQDRFVVVADAFGGNVAVISVTDPSVRKTLTIPAHNIRGLCLQEEDGVLVVSHQRLHSAAQTTVGDIHWGNLLGNHLRFLNLKDAEPQSRSLTRNGWLQDLGGPSHGAGDPGAMVATSSGQLIVCLSGVHAVEFVTPRTSDSVRVPVGQGPSAISLIPETDLAVVANRFSDTLTLIDTETVSVVECIPLNGNKSSPTAVQRGEALFHDATLSLDGWMS